MINNRQGGRRRGRGGQRGQNLGGQPGNRQDNRQRGNAAQLLEKYKSMARDAQLAGDRVQTEYYLQFADHYFRVLSESRARFEDQNRAASAATIDDDDEATRSDDGAEAEASRRRATGSRRGSQRSARIAIDRSEPSRSRAARACQPRRARRPRRDEQPMTSSRMNGRGETIPLDVLPPAIGRDETEALEASEEEPRRPRRRTRAPRPADGDDEIAPAA